MVSFEAQTFQFLWTFFVTHAFYFYFFIAKKIWPNLVDPRSQASSSVFCLYFTPFLWCFLIVRWFVFKLADLEIISAVKSLKYHFCFKAASKIEQKFSYNLLMVHWDPLKKIIYVIKKQYPHTVNFSIIVKLLEHVWRSGRKWSVSLQSHGVLARFRLNCLLGKTVDWPSEQSHFWGHSCFYSGVSPHYFICTNWKCF